MARYGTGLRGENNFPDVEKIERDCRSVGELSIKAHTLWLGDSILLPQTIRYHTILKVDGGLVDNNPRD